MAGQSEYFKNSKIQPKKKPKRNIFFDVESDSGARLSIKETWVELKEKLKNKEFSYNDLAKIKKTRFIEVLNEILQQEQSRKFVDIELKYYASSKKFLRAAIINSGENVVSERFVPRADKMNAANRFSPKGMEWLYLGFDRYMIDAKECCMAEIRAKEDSNVRFCMFEYNRTGHNVIDLTIADKMTIEEICTKQCETPERATAKFILQLYCKLLSEEIFLPVKNEDKDVEYAPFHCMAQYFKSLGYDGIIYKSTVSKVGKNMVMFDKTSFTPTKIL